MVNFLKVVFYFLVGFNMLASAKAQYVSLSYCENFTGRNIKGGIILPKNIELGLRYHINKGDYFKKGSEFPYYRNSYAEKPIHHIGLYALKSFSIVKTDKNSLAYFINANYSYMGVTHHFDPLDSNGNSSSQLIKYTLEPLSSLELNNGLMFTHYINSNTQIFAQAGAGFVLIYSRGGITVEEYTGQLFGYGSGLEVGLWGFEFRAGVAYRIW